MNNLIVINPKPLTVRQRIAAGYIASGLNQKETALELGIDEKTVGFWVKNPNFKNYVDTLLQNQSEDIQRQLYSLRLKALAAMEKSLSEGGPTALKAALEILDRTSLPLMSTNTHQTTLTDESWEKLRVKLRASVNGNK